MIVVVKVVVVRVEEKKENTREDFSHSLESLLAEIGEKRGKNQQRINSRRRERKNNSIKNGGIQVWL